ncbi:OsmC family protein [Hymenobacter properus]|uniref:OsmC family protein n=1 Tax=Hymenobacter properus TaxID=2791026 RepID=A0A931BKU8_9BACT|nr:OsmC family protein [Hymenobacter properus]MBF9141325.1 OsmC family protein [Hymenobacter properus]MBR7720135.1 OsmC family protein [Microvirga sp. SRT04]
MNTATARYAGNLRTEATHVASGTTIQTDAPVDNHGRGEAFSPTDLVSTALGACIITTMGIVAERHAWDLTGSTFNVTKHMSTDAPRRIAQIDVALTLPATLDANARTVLERAAHTCPVALSLHPDLVQNVVFEYR